MLDKLKKQCEKNLIMRIVGLAILVIVLSVIFAKPWLTYKNGPKELAETKDLASMEGEYVSIEAKYILGDYVRQVSVNKKTRVETLTNVGYLVFNDMDQSFYGIQMGSADEQKMDKIINATYNFLSGDAKEVKESVKIVGTVKKITGKKKTYWDETISELKNVLGSDTTASIVPYCIVNDEVNGIPTIFLWIVLGACGVLLVIIIIMIILRVTGYYKKDLKKYLKNHSNVTAEHLEAEFAAATAVGKKIYVGKQHIFYRTGAVIRILETKDLVWAYYFRRTGKQAESTLRVFNEKKKMRKIPASSAEASEILQIFEREQPHIVSGYDKDIEKMYNKDFQAFLNLQYNKAKNDRYQDSDGGQVKDEYAYAYEGFSENESKEYGADEKSQYSVELTEAGANSIQVIKVVREVTGLGLAEAKGLVDGAPKIVKEAVGKAEAEEIKAKLEAEGATVTLK